MAEEMRERALTLFLVVAVLLGVAFDLVTDEVRRPERLPVEGARLFEQASLCPAPIDVDKGAAQVSVAAATEDPTSFSIEGVTERLLELPGLGARVFPTQVFGAAVGYRRPLVASSTYQVSDPVSGSGAARCSRVASTRWYFPEGSSALGFDERLLLYNPFPDEAVAAVTFLTPTGDITRARLAQGIAVPAGEVRVVKINEFVPPQNTLGTVVEMNRGRVVAWRASLIDPDKQPAGMQFTLGARATAPIWYLPAGSVESGIDERITLMNPHRDEAVVSISLVTAEGTVQPPKLVEVRVAPETTNRVVLSEVVGRGQQDMGGAGAIVRSMNDVGVIAERTLWYDLPAVSGVSSEIGAAVARDRWIVGPALLKATTDTLLILNPGPESTRVDVALLTEGRVARPGSLRNVMVKAGTRRRIELRDGTGVVLVTADQPVVAERSATSGRDASAVLGTPAGE